MMFTATPYGFYPYAGMPGLAHPSAETVSLPHLEYLWVNPEIARGVLGYLAALQANRETLAETLSRENSSRDAQRRNGSLARDSLRSLLR